MNNSPQDPTPANGELSLAVGQLRALTCGLALAVLVLSVVVSIFIVRQNRNLINQLTAQTHQLDDADVVNQRLLAAVSEIAQYVPTTPELVPIFQKYGFAVQATPLPPRPASPPPSGTSTAPR